MSKRITRNGGKTALTTNIIKQFFQPINLAEIKISYPNYSFFHSKDRKPLQEGKKYRIKEEKSKSNKANSNKMLLLINSSINS